MSRVVLCLVWALAGGQVGDSSEGTQVLRALEQGDVSGALRRVERLLSGTTADDGSRRRLEELRARCLYELGDYPACEAALRGLLNHWSGSPVRKRQLQRQLAQVLDLEGVHDEALGLLDSVLKAGEDLEARRLAVRILLGQRRYEELRTHVGALLAARPDDPFALFARGVAAAKAGDARGAIPDLEACVREDALRRDARFELALVYARLERHRDALVQLYAIVSSDPFDVEACHQVGQQLLRDGRARLAASILRYFESLKSALGASSLDHHLLSAGRAAEAHLERARRFERVRDLPRSVEEVGQAVRLGAADAGVAVRAAEFWIRQGLLAEAEAVLTSGQERAGAPSVRRALSRVAELRAALRADKGALGAARTRLAAARWSEARQPLRALLEAARASSDAGLADRAARLLLAREPDSAQALEHLVDRTRVPELIIPHLHYLGRLARSGGARSHWRAELARGERLLLGR